MLMASLLITASATVAGFLGCIHLLYTFRGTKLHPRDPAVRNAMMTTSPVITRQTTVWRATQGFNATVWASSFSRRFISTWRGGRQPCC